MTHTRYGWLIAPLTLLAALSAPACGGDDESDGDAGAAGSGGRAGSGSGTGGSSGDGNEGGFGNNGGFGNRGGNGGGEFNPIPPGTQPPPWEEQEDPGPPERGYVEIDVNEESSGDSSATLCEVCTDTSDCAEGACLVQMDTGELFCSRSCGSDGDCPDDFYCDSAEGPEDSQCVPQSGTCRGSDPGGGSGGTGGSSGSSGAAGDGSGGGGAAGAAGPAGAAGATG